MTGGRGFGQLLLAPYLEDRTAIAFAAALAREAGGFVAPPGFAVVRFLFELDAAA